MILEHQPAIVPRTFRAGLAARNIVHPLIESLYIPLAHFDQPGYIKRSKQSENDSKQINK